MAITYFSSNNVNGTGNWGSGNPLVVPAGPLGAIQDGDILLAIACRANNTEQCHVPADFIELDAVFLLGPGSAAVGYKVASGESGDYSFLTDAPTDRNGAAGIAIFRGVDGTVFDVVFDLAQRNEVTAGKPDPAAITTGTDGAMVVVLSAGRLDTDTLTNPSTDYTEVWESPFPNNLARWVYIQHREIATAGPEDPSIIDLVSTNGAETTYTIALKPGAAGPPAPLFDGTIDDLNSVNGVPFSYDASVHFGTGGAVTSYSLQNAPAWMSIDSLGEITGTQNVDAIVSGITVTGTGDTAPPAVSNTFTSNGNPAYADSVVYNCVEIPSGSILHYAGGTADSGSATTMVDAGLVDTTDEFNDLIIQDRTNTTEGVISASNIPDNIVFSGPADFTGGGQDYAIVADIDNPDIIYYESPVSVVTESVDIGWYILDDNTGLYSPLYTQTISGLTGVADGNYTTSLDACGSITLTPVVLVPATLSNPTLVPTPGSTTSVDYSVTTDTVDGVMWLRYSLTFPQTDAWIKGGTSTPVTGTLFSGTTVGALPGETYYAYFLQETAAGDSNQQSAVTTMPLEIAVLTNEVADTPPFNTVTARVDTDQNGGDLRYLLNTSATAVEADLLGVGSRSQAVSQNVTQTITWSGAPTNTLVYVHFMQVTVDNSLVVSTAGVTTGEEVPVPPTSTINDAILIVTGGPTINDGLATWYGKTASETLPDAEYRWLIEQGATPATVNDMWFEFTGNLGYQGSLNDRQLQYWLNGGAGGAALVTFQGQQVTHEGEVVTNG